jgi:transcriptional regulator with XRE-family HTH domain
METVAACELVETFRQNLVVVMRSRELSQTAVQKLTGVPQPLISRILQGVQDDLNASTIWRISHGLGIEPRHMVDPDFEKILTTGLTAL